MSYAVEILTEEEVRRHIPANEEASLGALQTQRGNLPLCELGVLARISGLLVETEVTQTFVNTSGEPLEATYIFPLPDRAAVTKFVFEVDGRVVEGVLKERGQARREYNAAIAKGHRAAITEEERSDVFTMRVGNLMPGEHARVRLSLVGPLPFVDGEATFRFPLVVAPRFMPGKSLGGQDVGDGVAYDTSAVPDASRISPPTLLPGFPNPVQLNLAVEIEPSQMKVHNLRSSLHAVRAKAEDGRVTRIEIQPGERLNRDFILRLNMAESTVQTALTVARDLQGDEGTFALTLMPPQAGTLKTRPRDVVFVLDRSGSMGGWKMVAARRAVGRMIDSLRDDDQFCVLAFDDRIESPSSGALVQASNRERFRTVEYLAKLNARGGTEMYRPLESACDALSGGYLDRERVVVLITDGQVGNESQILKLLSSKLKSTRLFTLGIDRAVNGGFLKRMATSTGGTCELVESEDRLDEALARVGRRIESPVLAELALEAQGLQLIPGSISPQRLPDLFDGAPVVIQGRFREEGRGAITVKGTARDGAAWAHAVQASPATTRAVEQCWARGRVRDLEDRFDAGDQRLNSEIVQVSLKHGVLCRFTSFVAVDRKVAVNPGGIQRKVTQAVETPDGWQMLGAGDSLASKDAVRGRAAPAAGGASERMALGRAKARGAPSSDKSASSFEHVPDTSPVSAEEPPMEPVALQAAEMLSDLSSSAVFDADDDGFEEEDTGEVLLGAMESSAGFAEVELSVDLGPPAGGMNGGGMPMGGGRPSGGPPPPPQAPVRAAMAMPPPPAAAGSLAPPASASATPVEEGAKRSRRSGGLASMLVGAGKAVMSALGGQREDEDAGALLKRRGAELLAAFRNAPRSTGAEMMACLSELEPQLHALIDELRGAGLAGHDLVVVETLHRAVRELIMRSELPQQEEVDAMVGFVEGTLVAFAAATRAPQPPALTPPPAAAGGRREGQFWS